jgi:hypothetical protein
MSTFQSLDELLSILGKSKDLISSLFTKRMTLSLTYRDALTILDDNKDLLTKLIDNGVVQERNDYLELDNIYQEFFQNVLDINEDINIHGVEDYITLLNENIDYYLESQNEREKNRYLDIIKQNFKKIADATKRHAIDLKKKVDYTYKNEPDYKIKIKKLRNLQERYEGIKALMERTGKIIDHEQLVFFKTAMDDELQRILVNVKLDFRDCLNQLIDINRQIQDYLNLIESHSSLLQKIQWLKHLRDQQTISDLTNINKVAEEISPVWLDDSSNYKTYVSIRFLENEDEGLAAIKLFLEKKKTLAQKPKKLAAALSDDDLKEKRCINDAINIRKVKNSFVASGDNLFDFVVNYKFSRELSFNEKLVVFCQIATVFESELNFTDRHASFNGVRYPLIFPR